MQVIGRITHIPICMVCCDSTSEVLRDELEAGRVLNPMENHCIKRSFEMLPGYVDMDIISINKLDSILIDVKKAAVCCCMLRPTSEF